MSHTRLHQLTGPVCRQYACSVNEAHPAGDVLILIRIAGSTGSARQYWTHVDELVKTNSVRTCWPEQQADLLPGIAAVCAGVCTRKSPHAGQRACQRLRRCRSWRSLVSTGTVKRKGQRGRIPEVREREGAAWLLLKSDYITERKVQHG